MDNKIEQLFKNDGDVNTLKPSVVSKKLAESKRRLNSICRSLLFDVNRYDPKKTVEKVKSYNELEDNLGRLLYSEISTFFVGLDENSRGIFSTNISKLLEYVLDDNNDVDDPLKKTCIKFYDHSQLISVQIESANNITSKGISMASEKENERINNKVKAIEKDYITILGIFAAIMLAFVGAFTFSTSVLNNIGNASLIKLSVIAIIIGLVFIALVKVLLDFLREINDKESNSKNGKLNITSNGILAILIAILIGAIVCAGAIKINQMNKVDTNNSKSQVVEEVPMNDGFSVNCWGRDSDKVKLN